jgi:methylthioribose-1-phosphate isomerase
MKKFEIKNQEEFNECLMWISDLYKDVHGFRPRCYNFQEWSFQELTDFVNDLSQQAEEEAAYQRACEEKSIKDVMSLGVNRKTALRWLDQADAYFMYGNDPFYEDSIEKYGWVANHYDNLIYN